MAKSCPVCSRRVKTDNPQKGDVAWETVYCSHYCRLYDEQKLEKVPFNGGNKHHKGNSSGRQSRPSVKCAIQILFSSTMLNEATENTALVNVGIN